MSELEALPEKVASGIPYFYYDLFGRIVPGLFLIFGVCLARWNNSHFQAFVARAEAARSAEWIVGSAVLLVSSFVVGFLLSDLSRLLWRLNQPVTLTYLRDIFGSSSSDSSSVEIAFKSCFGFGLDHKSNDKTYLIYCGRLCEFVVICRNAALDSVNVRVAGEELLSRSLVVASVLLCVLSAFLREWWILAAYFGVTVVALSSYRHYRKKAIREKFQMFLALSHEDKRRTKHD